MGCGNTGGPSNGQTAEKIGRQLNADQARLPTDDLLSLLCFGYGEKRVKPCFSTENMGTINLQSQIQQDPVWEHEGKYTVPQLFRLAFFKMSLWNPVSVTWRWTRVRSRLSFSGFSTN